MSRGGPKLGAHGRERVLVVDPDRGAGEELGELLRDMGYAVEVARSGNEALSALTRVPPVLIFVNQALSGAMDAAGLLRGLRRMRDLKDVPVIATRPPGDVESESLREDGINSFLASPATRGAVESAVRVAQGREPLPSMSMPRRPKKAGIRTTRRLPPRRQAPPPPLPSTAIRPRTGPNGLRPVSTGSLVAVAGLNEVDSWLEWSDRREPCVLEKANADRVIIRCPDHTPELGTQIRLTVPLRTVIQDAMRDVPVRVLGEVIASKSLTQGARLKLKIKAARPEGNFRKLRAWLARG